MPLQKQNTNFGAATDERKETIMGLDIHLFRITKPTTITSGQKLSYSEYKNTPNNIKFLKQNDMTCDTIKNNSTECFIIEKYFDLEKMIKDAMHQFGIDIDDLGGVKENFVTAGSGYSSDMTSFSFRLTKKDGVLADFFKANKPDKKIPYYEREKWLEDGTLRSATLVNDDHMLVKFIVESDRYGRLLIKEDLKPEEIEQNDIPYINTVNEKRYAIVCDELAYQRGDLNDDGLYMLPENCTYCDSIQTVKELIARGGLDQSFIDEWIPEETVLWAWW